MAKYTKDFEVAFNLTMLSEVGDFFDPTNPVTISGVMVTKQDRKLCGYVNNPKDPGGETKYGIAKKFNPSVNIDTLTLEQAKQLYFDKYWIIVNCDKIKMPLGALYFDAVVNSGSKQGTVFLQKALGAKADGSFGPGTLSAAAEIKDIKVACSKFIDVREKFFRDLVAKNPDQYGEFLAGWLNRITMLRGWLAKQK